MEAPAQAPPCRIAGRLIQLCVVPAAPQRKQPGLASPAVLREENVLAMLKSRQTVNRLTRWRRPWIAGTGPATTAEASPDSRSFCVLALLRIPSDLGVTSEERRDSH
jgi:hypothetical protein